MFHNDCYKKVFEYKKYYTIYRNLVSFRLNYNTFLDTHNHHTIPTFF